jgi:cysteine-rich secretory family protein
VPQRASSELVPRALWLVISLALVATSLACKKEEPPASYPQTAPGALPGSSPGPVAPAPAPAPVAGAAALGLPCASDRDLQCAFAHCAAGRCGGCRSSAECKPGSYCLASWLGYACFPSLAQTSAPSPVPVPGPASPTNSADPLAILRARCVQRTNEYRARASVAPVTRRSEREACADGEAQSDGASGTAHGSFGRCQEGAQNECPGWPGPIDQVIDKCLSQMFAEGPGPFEGHGHYLNMTAPSYTAVACGFASAPNGQTWIVQNFYR